MSVYLSSHKTEYFKMFSIQKFVILYITLIYLGVESASVKSAHGKPTIPGSNEILRISLEDTVELFCNFTTDLGDPIEVNWYKDDDLLSSTQDSRIQVFLAGKVTIKKVEDDDIDKYECEAKQNRSLTKSFNLWRGNIIELDKSMDLSEGEDLVLTCEAEGKPQPVVLWKKGNETLEAVVNGSRISFGPNTKGIRDAQFNISNVVASDTGTYTCFAEFTPGAVLSTSIKIKGPSDSDDGWDSGVIAGIVIGTIGGLCLLVLVVVFVRQRFHHRSHHVQDHYTD